MKIITEVYNVKEEMEIGGLSEDILSKIPEGWYEYRAMLINDDGDIISEFDSYVETYNGVQRLTKEKATLSASLVDESYF